MSGLSGVSYDQSPPLSVPLRFFLSAPVFGILAAGLLFWLGPDFLSIALTSPMVLAVNHLLTLGFVTMVIFGAMQQMLPVLANSPLKRAGMVAAIVHISLGLGVLVLTAGLVLKVTLLIQLSLLFLGSGSLVFLYAVTLSLLGAMSRSATVGGMRLTLISLTVVIAFGLRLGAEHVWHLQPLLSQPWTDVHLAWALVGWVALLVISVAYEVVPMFQLTPAYPRWMRRWLVPALFACLAFWSIAYLQPAGMQALSAWLSAALSFVLASGLAVFACTTLYLLTRRRRRLADVTLQYWRVGMISLFAATALFAAARFWPALAQWQHFGLMLGVLMIAGFAMSVMAGMLYKIVPFLVWFHLQGMRSQHETLPHMKEIVPEGRMRVQLWLHVLALALMLTAVAFHPWFIYAASAAFGISNLLLWLNLLSAGKLYWNIKLQMAE